MTDAQFDATVGKQNNGLSISFATYLHITGTSSTDCEDHVCFLDNVHVDQCVTIFMVESPPYQIKSKDFSSESLIPSRSYLLLLDIGSFHRSQQLFSIKSCCMRNLFYNIPLRSYNLVNSHYGITHLVVAFFLFILLTLYIGYIIILNSQKIKRILCSFFLFMNFIHIDKFHLISMQLYDIHKISKFHPDVAVLSFGWTAMYSYSFRSSSKNTGITHS